MRIDANIRIAGAVTRQGTARAGQGAGFVVDEGQGATSARAAAPMAPPSSLDALLALQSVEDPLQRRRRLVRRGRQLLDTLESLRNELLLGRVSEAGLNQLVGMLANARERGEAGLDALLDDIELRVRVELAKRGIFPG